MADVTPPVVSGMAPASGAVNVPVTATISFDVVDPPEGGTAAYTAINLSQHFGHEDLSSQVTGSTALFTAASPYVAGSLMVWLDGALQDGVVETGPAAGTFTLAAIPPSGILVADYTVDWQINSVDLDSVVITVDGVTAFQSSAWQPFFSGTITPIDFGYHFTIPTHDDFAFGSTVAVTVTAQDLASPPNAMVSPFSWSFNVLVPVTRRRPFITSMAPTDGQLGVVTSSDMSFTIKTDNLSAASINTTTVNVWLNGAAIVLGGINVAPAQYAVTLTPGTRLLDVLLNPAGSLALDQHFTVLVQASDNVGTAGGGTYEFDTGAVAFACVLDRTEPLLCPTDNVPVPLFTTRANVTTTQYADTLSSITTDWYIRGTAPYSTVVVDGPEAGRWITRDPSNPTIRLFHTNLTTSAGNTATVKLKTELADRNPVQFITSPIMQAHHQRVWGDLALRYYAGYASDDFFPAGWEEAEYSDIHDNLSAPSQSNGGVFEDQLNRRLDFTFLCDHVVDAGHWDRYSLPLAAKLKPTLISTASLTPGSATVPMAGSSYRTELTVGATVTFGSDLARYTVATIGQGALHQITLTAVWVGAAPLAAQAVHRLFGGTRSLICFRTTTVSQGGASLFMGLANNQNSPVSDSNNRIGVEFLFGTSSIKMRAYSGSTYQEVDTAISLEQFCAREWVAEIEMIDEVTTVVRLLDFDDLSQVLPNRSVQVTGVAVTLDRWTLTTFGGAPGTNVVLAGYVRHVDVEFGTGVPYELVGLLQSSNAKARAPRNLQNLQLVSPSGWKTVETAIAVRRLSPYPAQYDQIFFDTDDTYAFVDSYSIDGSATTVLDRGQPTQRTARKFSFQAGFDKIRLSFHSNKRGFYTILVDSTDTVNGFAVARGVYEQPGQVVNIVINGRAFDGLANGPHQLHAVVCKDPIPTLSAVFNGQASLTARGTVVGP